MDPYKRTVTREQSVLRTGKIASLCSIISLLALTSQAQTAATPAPDAPASPAIAAGAEVKPEETVVLEEFITTGIRGSAIKAIEVKRNNPQVMEAIVSEDIGKFPDNNVVESLQRVPGLQVTGYGRGQIGTVTIRGLPDITTTLNGRNIFTAAGTAYSLQDVPASLLKEVDIKKTRAASDIESGMAGVIDIHTNRPFDFAGRKTSLVVKGMYHEQAKKYDPNLSMLYSDRWKVGSTGKFGALLNLSFSTQHYRDMAAEAGAQFPFASQAGAVGYTEAFFEPAGTGWSPFRRIATNTDWFQMSIPAGISSMWTPGTDLGLPSAAGSTFRQIINQNGTATVPAGLLNAQYLLAPDAIILTDQVGKTTRPAANLSLQFAPDDKSEYTFELFYNGFRNENGNNMLFVQTWEWFNVNPASVTYHPGTNIIKTRTNPNGNVWTSSDSATAKTDSLQYSLMGKWKITPDFQLKSEIVYQDSRYSSTFFAVRTRSARFDQVPMSMDFNANNGVPMVRFNNGYDLNNLNNWWLGHAWDSGTKDKGSATSLTEEGVINIDWPAIKKIKFGYYYDYRKAATSIRESLEQTPLGNDDIAPSMSTMPQVMTNVKGFFDGRADLPSSWAIVDSNYLRANSEKLRPYYPGMTPLQYQTTKEIFNINEITQAVYLQADEMKIDIAGHKLTGQFGVRAVNIATGMSFTSRDVGNFNVTQGTAGTSKFLPSAAFNFEITKDFIARLAYGETIRRPGFNDLNPLVSHARDVSGLGYGTGGGGNPNLKPTESKNLDVSLEYYFDEGSMVHVTAFTRKIDGLVVSFTTPESYTDAIGPYNYYITRPANASNGTLKGFEVGGKYFPKNLPSVLQGFGVEGSFTNLTSSQDIPIVDPTTGKYLSTYKSEFFGVSKSSLSGTVAYERGRHSARLSYSWRSEFLNGRLTFAANPGLIYEKPQRSLNFQYSIRAMDNLTISLEATNLNNDIMHSYYGNTANASLTNNRVNWIVSRTFALSARYSF